MDDRRSNEGRRRRANDHRNLRSAERKEDDRLAVTLRDRKRCPVYVIGRVSNLPTAIPRLQQRVSLRDCIRNARPRSTVRSIGSDR